MNPVRDKNGRQEPGGSDDTCDHGLSRSWKIDVCEEGKKKWGGARRACYVTPDLSYYLLGGRARVVRG